MQARSTTADLDGAREGDDSDNEEIQNLMIAVASAVSEIESAQQVLLAAKLKDAPPDEGASAARAPASVAEAGAGLPDAPWALLPSVGTWCARPMAARPPPPPAAATAAAAGATAAALGSWDEATRPAVEEDVHSLCHQLQQAFVAATYGGVLAELCRAVKAEDEEEKVEALRRFAQQILIKAAHCAALEEADDEAAPQAVPVPPPSRPPTRRRPTPPSASAAGSLAATAAVDAAPAPPEPVLAQEADGEAVVAELAPAPPPDVDICEEAPVAPGAPPDCPDPVSSWCSVYGTRDSLLTIEEMPLDEFLEMQAEQEEALEATSSAWAPSAPPPAAAAAAGAPAVRFLPSVGSWLAPLLPLPAAS